MSNIYKQFLNDNLSLLDIVASKYSMQCISGELEINNHTYITDQPYLLSSYLSTVTINNSIIHDIASDGSMFSLTDTAVTINSIEAYNLHTTGTGNFILLSFGSEAVISNITYTNSTTKFIESLSSKLQIISLMSNNIALSQYLISYTDCVNIVIQNLMIYDINSTYSYLIYATGSSIDQIMNMTVYDINVPILHILKSNVTLIDNLHAFSIPECIYAKQSSIGLLQNSRIYRSGSTNKLQGGAMLIENSNSTIKNMTFEYNIARSGGAIYINCDSYDICRNIINGSTFSDNTAIEQGGAIYYDYRRPELSNITFNNNDAFHGPDIGSYPVRIVNSQMINEPIVLTNVASGMIYNETLKLLLVDYDGQTMNLVNNSQIKISPVTSGASLLGVDYSVLVNGEATFDALLFVYAPGQDNIQFLATSDLIDPYKVSYLSLPTNDSIDVSFRY